MKGRISTSMPDALATFKLCGADPPGRPTRLTGDTSGRYGAPPRTPIRSHWTVRRDAACYAALDEFTGLRIHQQDTGEPHVHIVLNRVHSKPEVLVNST